MTPKTLEAETAMVPATPLELLRIAVSQNSDIEKLTRLMDLQERWERNEARKAFVAAMNAFKSDPPRVLKNRHVQAGQMNYDHATLDSVCDAVIHGLSTHGLSHRWKIEQADGLIRVICIITHEGGHSEETALHGSADTSGAKNAIQAIGSTVTYLQRYTLLAACGLAASNSDTDGHVQKAGLAPDRVREQCEWIANASSLDELKTLYKNAYVEASDARDRAAMNAYIKAKDARKKELQ